MQTYFNSLKRYGKSNQEIISNSGITITLPFIIDQTGQTESSESLIAFDTSAALTSGDSIVYLIFVWLVCVSVL